MTATGKSHVGSIENPGTNTARVFEVLRKAYPGEISGLFLCQAAQVMNPGTERHGVEVELDRIGSPWVAPPARREGRLYYYRVELRRDRQGELFGDVGANR